MKVSFTRLLLLLLVSATPFFTAAQEYDVLPSSGRNLLFNNYLLSEFDSSIAKRQAKIADAMSSKAKLEEHQVKLYEDYQKLLGAFPEKTPLNANIVGTVAGNGEYRIEKLHYQSRPNHHVTANFYIPETGTGPYPTVIILCGHYPAAKSYTDYQRLSASFARNGIAALIVDPICQGERYQMHDTDGKLSFPGTSGTSSLSKLDPGSALNGSSTGAHLLWDNVRSVDYLYSRTDVVDTTKIGCTGHSGGGGQATNLLAFDKRLKVGAVANYISNETKNFKVLGPQTAPQNLAFEGEKGFDTPDYITLFAPKPYMIIATTVDFFDIEGTRETFAEVQAAYDTLGAKENVTLFETSDMHDYTKIKREAAVRWFKKWFLNNNDTVIEADMTTLPSADLQVSATGNVYTSFNGELTIQDMNLEMARKDSVVRKEFWANNSKDSCLSLVKQLIKLKENYPAPVATVTETIDRTTYTIDKVKITSGNNVPVTGLLFKPKSLTAKAPTTLYVNGDGKAAGANAGDIIEDLYVNKGQIVFSIDVRGFGETADKAGANDSKHGNDEFRNAEISFYTGKTLVGQRVEDIMKAVTVLLEDNDVDPATLTIEGLGRAATAVLHAGALDTRIQNVVLRKAFKSWTELIENPTILNQMTEQVNGALKHYDLPDLAAAMAPRTVEYAKAQDASLKLLVTKNGKLAPVFAPNVLTYDVTTLRNAKIIILPYLADANASFTATTDTADVSTEAKTVEIVVTAEDGKTTRTYTVNIPMFPSTGIADQAQSQASLGQNYPNPFGDESVIEYTLAHAATVSLAVYSMDGSLVKSLANKEQAQGSYTVSLSASSFLPGVYYYQLLVDGAKVATKKMVVTE